MADELSCPICEQEYNAQTRTPRVLPCGHTFCSECLIEMFQKGYYFCPEDRLSLEPIDVNDLPKNFSILRMGRNSPDRSQSNCRIHKRVLELMCLDDQVQICTDCALFGEHIGHKLQPLEALVSEKEAQSKKLESLLEEATKLTQAVFEGQQVSRIRSLPQKHATKKAQLEAQLQTGFQTLRSQLDQLEAEAKLRIDINLEGVTREIQSFVELVEPLKSTVADWSDKVQTYLRETSCETYSSETSQELLAEGTELINTANRITTLDLDPIEGKLEEIDVFFTEKSLKDVVYVTPQAPPANKAPQPRASNEEVFAKGLLVLKLHTDDVADFSGAGDLGDRAAELADYLATNQYLKKLKLVKNNISDAAAIVIFKALEGNTALQSLNLSQNQLGAPALEALIRMLEENSTLKDIILLGNHRMSYMYKNKLESMSVGTRKIRLK